MAELRKIVSINPGGDFGTAAAKEHLLWPCKAFTVTMPSRPRKTLNVIETCILRLTPLEAGNTDRIAAAMCDDNELEDFKQLVAFVQSRLAGMGYLTDTYELTDNGKSLLGAPTDQPQSTGVFTVLKDCLTGALVPHIHGGAFSYLEVVEDTGGRVKFLPDSQKKRNPLNARSIFVESMKVSAPKPSDITKLLRRISKRELGRTKLPDMGAIVVSPAAETVYLHCMAILPEAGGELIITDGFGRPSEKFRQALLGAKWLDDFRSRAVGGGSKLRTDDDTSSKAAYYMRNVHKKLERLTNRTASTSEHDAQIRAAAEAFREIYGDIERALNEALQRSAVRGSKWAGVFGGGQAGSSSNAAKFKKYAKDAGFDVDEDLAVLMEIPPSRFKAYENGGNYDMWMLLALASAQAHDDTDHPLRQIARKDPGFLKFIAGLKAKRDAASHGGEVSGYDAEQWREIITRTENALRLLLPGIQFGDTEAETVNAELDAAAVARGELEQILGFEYVSRIKDKGLFLQLQRVRMMLTDNPDASQCLEAVTSLASCLQVLAEEHLREGSLYRTDVECTPARITERVRAAGFTFRDAGELDTFLTTNTGRILQALKGRASTLGGAVSAFLLVEDEETLKEFAKLCPEYVRVVSRLVVLRGHGNVWEGKADLQELRELEGEVHKIIKIFEEEF